MYYYLHNIYFFCLKAPIAGLWKTNLKEQTPVDFSSFEHVVVDASCLFYEVLPGQSTEFIDTATTALLANDEEAIESCSTVFLFGQQGICARLQAKFPSLSFSNVLIVLEQLASRFFIFIYLFIYLRNFVLTFFFGGPDTD